VSAIIRATARPSVTSSDSGVIARETSRRFASFDAVRLAA
jgi:hypothetical protein